MPPSAPNETGDDDSRKELIDSINESAKHLNTTTVTFLAVSAYLGIAVASTTGKLLLLGTRISLPLLDVQIPLTQFYIVAPGLLVLLQLTQLLQQYLLARKIELLQDAERDGDASRFFPALPVAIILGTSYHTVVKWMLEGVFVAVNFVPAVLLVWAQISFLPYHSVGITFWHHFLVAFDLGLVWYFFFRTPFHPPRGQSNVVRVLGGPSMVAWLSLFSLALAVTSLIAQGPGTGYEFRQRSRLWEWVAYDLHLGGGLGLTAAELPAKSSAGESAAGGEGHDAPGLDLTGRDLRNADLTGAVMARADFRRALLDHADLTGANLTDATFVSPDDEVIPDPVQRELRLLGKTAHHEAASLRGTRLRAATLRRAHLFGVDLRGADLSDAHLEEADLSLADLRKANLNGAHLQGANLAFTRLDLADLTGADLRAASLPGASLIGANLLSAKLAAADLTDTDLRGAHLALADAFGAQFAGAKARGADFREATLSAASGLRLDALRLRWADLGDGRLFCDDSSPAILDLRNVNFPKWQGTARRDGDGDIWNEQWEQRLADLSPVADQAILKKVEHPLWRLPFASPCGTPDLPLRVQAILYDRQLSGPLQAWSPQTATDAEFYQQLAAIEVTDACSRQARAGALAQNLLQEVAGEFQPPDDAFAVAVAREILQRVAAAAAMAQSAPDRHGGRRCPQFQHLSEDLMRRIERLAHQDLSALPHATARPGGG